MIIRNSLNLRLDSSPIRMAIDVRRQFFKEGKENLTAVRSFVARILYPPSTLIPDATDSHPHIEYHESAGSSRACLRKRTADLCVIETDLRIDVNVPHPRDSEIHDFAEFELLDENVGDTTRAPAKQLIQHTRSARFFFTLGEKRHIRYSTGKRQGPRLVTGFGLR